MHGCPHRADPGLPFKLKFLVMSVQESECSHAKAFIQELVTSTNSLLSLFDSVIPTSEVIPGSELHLMYLLYHKVLILLYFWGYRHFTIYPY